MEPTVRVYTVEEVMQILKVSRNTVYRLFDAKVLRRIKVGHLTRIPAEDIHALLASGNVPEDKEE